MIIIECQITGTQRFSTSSRLYYEFEYTVTTNGIPPGTGITDNSQLDSYCSSVSKIHVNSIKAPWLDPPDLTHRTSRQNQTVRSEGVQSVSLPLLFLWVRCGG